MEAIEIKSQIHNYNIILHDNVKDLIKKELDSSAKYFVVIDNKISNKYRDLILQYLPNSYLYEIEGGECAKTFKQYEKLLKELLRKKVTKDDYLIAFGGGSISDLVGYVASTYKRGISFITIPTTVLSMVDASIGGKNSINLGKVKNAVGTIYPPVKVLIGLDTLETLEKREFNNGLFEAIKTGMILDAEIYGLLKNKSLDLYKIIKLCLISKKNIVEQDEYDQNIRNILNFGHTFGHAFEVLSNYDLKHGEAIANGMLVMSKGKAYYDELKNMLLKLGCPQANMFDTQRVFKTIRNDKKANSRYINIVTVPEIGKGKVEKIKFSDLKGIYENYVF